MRSRLSTLRDDVPASVVVFLVALPLCLGIALASGAPLVGGVITGIVGGLVAGALSGSALAVSGPAAGLAIVVLEAIEHHGYEAFVVAVALSGIIQLAFGYLRAGLLGDFIPDAVIKGMLAAIGIILIMKQIPHAVGWDADPEGDLMFRQPDGETTISAMLRAGEHVAPGAVLITVVSLAILLVWDSKWVRGKAWSKLLPGPLVVVIVGAVLNGVYGSVGAGWVLSPEQLVSLPVADSVTDVASLLTRPDFSVLSSGDIYGTAVILAIVASLETLLSIEATDKLDPLKRVTPPNRELKAQGAGNLMAGLLGGLPMTAVIVRSSANVSAGAMSQTSAILHGLWLLLALVFAAQLANMIPLSSLAAILLIVGFKLNRPQLYRSAWARGWNQFIPFVTTIVAIYFTDLLIGIIIGLAVGLFFVVKTNYHAAINVTQDGSRYLVKLNRTVSFLNKADLRSLFSRIDEGSYVIIDGTKTEFLDDDVVETIMDFCNTAPDRGISVELKRRPGAFNPYFKLSPEGEAQTHEGRAA